MITADLRLLQGGGLGTYQRHVAAGLIAGQPERAWTLLGEPDLLAAEPWARRDGVAIRACRAGIYSVREQWELPALTPRETGLFWAPSYNIPVLHHRGRLMVTVHDTLHLARPEDIGAPHRRAYARGMYRAIRARADAIVFVSRFTADEFARYVGRPKGMAEVIHNGVDPSWFAVPDGASPHPRPYVIAVGNVKPHKNLAGAMGALGLLGDRVPHDLVVVGQRGGFKINDPATDRAAEGLGDRVHFTGRLDDAEVQRWVAHADALVYPSFYEGFGLPPLEAMACGCPVVAARAASIPEVCGDAVLYCDPARPDDIARQLHRVLTEPSLRADLRGRGIEQARRYTWSSCTAQTEQVVATQLAAG